MKIKLVDVSAAFGKKEILRNVSLDLSGERLTMLIGPNGSGKTTLLRAVMGFQRLSNGCIFYDGRPLLEYTVLEKSRKVAYMPQRQGMSDGDTVLEYVLLGAAPYLGYFSLPGKKLRNEALQVLEELGILPLRDRKMAALSGGERQMVNFARARLQNTPWLILDEPMAALDFNRQHEFMHRLLRYEKQYGQGILMSVHDPNFALRYADQVIVLGDGQVRGTADRREDGFEKKLTGILNQAYGGHLRLIEQGEYGFYQWKEEQYVPGKGICEGAEPSGGI